MCATWVLVGGLIAETIVASDMCSEEEAQMRIYHASWDGGYEFRCEMDEEASRELASMFFNPRVNWVRKNQAAKIDVH
jgi:hypothetical protein